MRPQQKTYAAGALVAGILAAAAVSGTAAAETHDLSVTRVFEAPVERLWSAWSEPAEVKKWWAPAGFTTPVAEMDFREGGSSVVCMRPPEGPDLCNTWTYRKIIPNESIEFVLGWSDEKGAPVDPRTMGLPPDIPTEVRHLIAFRDLGGGRTEMTVNEYGYSSVQTVEQSKAGLEQVLDKLEASIAAE
jgi:uncharacterized protein YndB with AHSA1/START domain